MYNVSSSFRDAMKKPAQFRRLYGTVGGINFIQKNILQGTFAISNQCSSSSEIQIGQVYVGELKATFRGIDIPRRNWKGKEIVVYQGIKIGDDLDDLFEDVLLGHYFIDSAKWSKVGVDITAYDAMSKFDKDLKITSSTGTIYDFTMLCCNACGVEFGMTREQVATFVNGVDIFGIYQENDIETHRDLISWCAQTLGANATISREGKLVYIQFSNVAVESFNDKQRLDGGTVSDFDTFYTGLSVVNIGDMTTSYYGAEVDNGLTMNLGSNPLLQYGTAEVLEQQRRAILTAIQKINYTPSKFRINTPMIFDLMDVIEFTGGLVGEGNSIKVCITRFTWKYNGDYEIECVGADPALTNNKSKVDKNLAGLLEQVDANKIVTYEFTNAIDLLISDSYNQIISIDFTSKEKSSAIFLATILIDVTANNVEKRIEGTLTLENESKNVVFDFTEKTKPVIEINYKLNDSLIETFMPEQILCEGKHIINLYYPLLSLPDVFANKFEVLMKITNGSAKILRQNILATITGQGLVADYSKWDGKINIEEEIGLIGLSNVSVVELTDELNIDFDLPTSNQFTEIISGLKLNNISVAGFKDSIVLFETMTKQDVSFNCTQYTEFVEDNLQLKTVYTYISNEESIDVGKLSSVEVKTDDKKSIESVVIENG